MKFSSFKCDLFVLEGFPVFNCPRCKKGRFSCGAEDVRVEESTHSIQARNHAEWDPSWDESQFYATYKCSHYHCGQISILIGTIIYDLQPAEDEDSSFEWIAFFNPMYFTVAPHLIDLPDGLPRDVELEIIKSFKLFWSDNAACGNKLRTAVEYVLNDLGVADVSSKGFPRRLVDRVSDLKTSYPDLVDSLNALRVIGNFGAHGEDVNRSNILDAFEVFEHFLEEIYSGRKEKIREKANKLLSLERRGVA